MRKREDSRYYHMPPARRPLRIYASDPMLARTPGNRLTIEVANERVQSGPRGSRFEVVDYDASRKAFYPPVDLNDPAILLHGGLEPTESDPRFHQQMVYAVAMRTLENFERALGRRLEFRRTTRGRRLPRLRLFPHAFHGANAFYDRDLNAILFGYFRADRRDPGPNLPGQVVYTCLSHDIIAHELTHAIVDRLRHHFLEPTNPDVLAFHEGFADIVALFQHFSFQEFLREQIQRTRSDIRRGQLLFDLAQQFGYATGTNQALRSAIGQPDKRLYETMLEPHERGSILVAAVFDAFFSTYDGRIRDLVRIATGGTGTLPDGDLHPDLVNRIAAEASRTAQSILTMCIRAFDYLPAVDVTFGDYLRALVTADYELLSGEDAQLRSAAIEAFRVRGIYPAHVASLAEESLIWEEPPATLPRLPSEKIQLASEIALAAEAFNQDPFAEGSADETWGSYGSDDGDDPFALKQGLAVGLHEYAVQNAAELQLDPRRSIRVRGFHTVFRVKPRGQILPELVVQYVQTDDSRKDEFGGIPLRGGTTIVAGVDGRVRYVIAKPLTSAAIAGDAVRAANERAEKQREYLAHCDLADPRLTYDDEQYELRRSLERSRLASLHEGLA